jgi:Ca2+-binding RTX toxin-like protein
MTTRAKILGGNKSDYLAPSGALAGTEIEAGNGNDTVVGTGWDDIIRGGNGKDSLSGGGGDDRLEGGNGVDWLAGGAGNDTLVGGIGADTLTGGAGRDVFAFATIDGAVEIVTDFDTGALGDALDLSDVLTGFVAGSSNPSDFVQFGIAAGGTTVRVDSDGAANGANFVDVCLLQGVTLSNVNQAVMEGNLVLA